MKILITGSGFIGTALACSLATDGHEISMGYRNAKPFEDAKVKSNIKLFHYNLSTEMPRCNDVDLIIHNAGLTPDSNKTQTINNFVDGNINSTVNLLEFIKVCKPKVVIYLSTISVYGSPEVKTLIEETQPNKADIYGVTKYCAEQILNNCSGDTPTITLRLPGVLGPCAKGVWLSKLLSNLINNTAVNVYNPDSDFNGVVDVYEIKRFIDHIIDNKMFVNDVYNFAANDTIKVSDLVNMFVRGCKSNSQINTDYSQKSAMPVISIEKLLSRTGFEPRNIDDVVRRYIEDNCKDKI